MATLTVPSKALYIKLGRGGMWERECIEKEQTLRLSYREILHDLCLKGKWDEVLENLIELRGDLGAAKRDAKQIQLFHESDESVLCISIMP